MKTKLSICVALLVVVAFEHNMVTSWNNFHRRGLFSRLEKLRKRNHPAPEYPSADKVCFGIEQLIELKEQFEAFIDSNKDGKATLDEIKQYLSKYNDHVTDEQARDFLERRNLDGNDAVDFIPDYLNEMARETYSPGTAREWFELEDSNHDNSVSKEELIAIALNIGMSPEEAEETAKYYYMGADTDRDGKLSWPEYSKLFEDNNPTGNYN